MPTYEYKCKKCGKVFEILQSMKDTPLKHHYDIGHPGTTIKCNGKVERQIPKNVNIILKGTGWTQKFYTKSGKDQRKLDSALNKLNIEDASDGWSKKEDGED